MAEHDESIVVRFVKVSENTSDLMQNAFSALSDANAKSVWFEPNDCLSVTKRDKRIFYVFDSFSGRFFDHIVATGSRIYGPSCIMQCLKNKELLPRLSHPVFSKAMEGLVICCTNLSGQLRDDVYKQVMWMMGEVSKDFHERVTHLVVGEVGSKKYKVAVSLKRKIMTLEWVSTVWQKCLSQLVKADDPTFDDLRCPPFKGFVICVSGFDSEERNRMKHLVESAGGKYSGEMKINECTHLVVSVARGQKYEFARKWKINIVGPKWIDDCVESSYCLEEQLYAVDKPVSKAEGHHRGLTSTPTGEGAGAANISMLSNLSAVSMTTINETGLSRPPSLMTGQGLPREGRCSPGRNAAALKDRAQTAKESVMEALSSINLTNAKAGSFLDGCKIFLCGIPSAHLERVRRIINLGGGTRFNQINESVSHVVVGETSDEAVERLLSASFRPKVVTVRWLIDCFDRGLHLPEDEYRCIDVPELMLSASPSEKRINEKHSRKGSGEAAVYLPPESARSDVINTAVTKECIDDMHDVLSQYMPSMTGFSIGESTLLRAADVGVHHTERGGGQDSKEETSKHSSRQDDEATVYVPPNASDEDQEMEEKGLIFAGLHFLIFGFDGEELEIISNLITEHGGTVLPHTTRSVPDYGVVPLFGCPVRATVGEVVTNAWVQTCIENERLLPVESSAIFSPMSLVSNARPLLGCILSISGYSGIERDVLLEVSHALGGTCQDYFLRKAKGSLLASTHLIVQSPEGSKYVAAKKWNIPAVNKMWLFECARTGKRSDVKDFLIDSHPDESCVRNRLVEMGSVTPSSVASANKRLAAEPSVPAKRSRGEIQSEESSREAPAAGENSREDSALNGNPTRGDKFKEPAVLPPVSTAARLAADVANPGSGVSYVPPKNGPAVSPPVRENRLSRSKRTLPSGEACSGKDGRPENSGTESPSPGVAAAAASVRQDSYRRVLKNARLEELVQDARRTPLPAPADDSDTPTSEEPYRMKLNLTGILSPWASPIEASKQTSRTSLPLEDLFAESIGIAIKNCESRSKKDDSFSQNTNCDSFSVNVEVTSGPLKGVIIAVAKKLSKNQAEYNGVAASLGAEYRWTYDSGCTHFIFQGRLNDTNKEFRLARDQGKFVVSPHWLSACADQNCHLDESGYPHTFNPSLSLSITGQMTPSHRAPGLKTPARFTRVATRTQSDSIQTAQPHATNQKNIESTKKTSAKDSVTSTVVPVITAENSVTAKNGVTAENGISAARGMSSASADGAAVPAQDTIVACRGAISDADVAAALDEKMDEEVFEMTGATLSDEELANACENLENQDRSSARESTLLNGLKRLNEASRNHGRGKPLARYHSSEKDSLINASASKSNRLTNEGNAKEETDELKTASSSVGKTATAPKVPRCTKTLVELHTQPSQFVEVVWDDPGAREQREMLASDLEKNSESPGQDFERGATSTARTTAAEKDVIVIPDVEPVHSTRASKPGLSSEGKATGSLKPSTSENAKKSQLLPSTVLKPSDEKPSTSKTEGTAKKRNSKPVFIFSGLSPDDRDNFARVIEDLGGIALDTTNYTNECTHLIIEKPTRNEKFLACVATGKWVLHKSYIDACVAANEFILEESYEWGAKATAAIWNSLPPQAVKLAEAACRWRRQLSKSGKKASRSHGAFESWRVLLLTESRREDGFQRLLEAGGATVLSNKLPLNHSKATHAFIDLAKLKFQVDLEAMVRSGVSCVRPEYIASYLTDDPRPEPAQFFIPEVNKFLK